MDYPQLNLFFGLSLMLVLAINMALRVLLSRQSLPVWMSIVSWTALVLSAISTLYIEILFLQRMTPAFHRQIGLGVLLIGGILAPITAFFYRRGLSPRATSILFGMQIVASLICLVLAFGLYRSLVPMPGVSLWKQENI